MSTADLGLVRLIEAVTGALDQEEILYMVIGGQAVLIYGEPRLTKDIDITLGVGPESLNRILNLCDQLSLAPLVADPVTFVRQTMVLPVSHQESSFRVDLIFSFSPYEAEALGRVNLVRVGDVDVRFTSLEDLIIHKIIAGRPRDLEDVRSILLKNPGYDRDLIIKWLKEFDLALAKDLVSVFAGVESELK